ncbi:MAG: MerR family transcriptional regulator [Sphingomonadales bacterium]
MVDSLDIAEVARTTGLTSRALRFYEARGLVKPLRTASGRRHYGTAELDRINQIVTLKRAGLSLAQIERLIRRGAVDLNTLIDAQIAAVAEQVQALAETRALLLTVKSRIERSEPIDVATLCSLIRYGDIEMTDQAQAWKQVSDQYMSEEAKADFVTTTPLMCAEFDQADYAAKWKDLGARVKAALPLDPTSDVALAYAREWRALLEPFMAVATPAMMEGSRKMYANMGEWQGKNAADPGFDFEVFEFIQAATVAARSAGHDIDYRVGTGSAPE